MKRSFEIMETFPAKPATIYEAWLSSKGHSQMTGGAAECSDKIGGEFNAWDGYISGKNVSLEPGKRIEQTWRTTEFRDEDADSHLVIELKAIDGGCELTLIHSNIPEGQPDYKQGWEDHYFKPMRAFFAP